MSSSIWARVARTCFIRPRVGSGPLLARSFVLLTAKPVTHVSLRPLPFLVRPQSSVATARAPEQQVSTSTVVEDAEEELPAFSTLEGVVDKRLLKALTGGPFNLTTMSSVQARVLPLLPEIADPYDAEKAARFPRDLLVRARTGTGKTIAFLVPAIEARLKAIEAHVTQASRDSGLGSGKNLSSSAQRRFASQNTGVVVISPTRELATQIAKEASKLTKHLDGFEVQLFVGGESKSMQLRNFRRGTHDIIVATPGRLRDLLSSCPEVADSIAKTETLVLDEADTLLDMGFQPDILAIQEYMPKAPERQTFLFSATVSPAIRDVARASLAKHHRFINCVSDDASPVHSHIPQYHTVLPSAEHQIPHVLRLLAHDQLSNPSKSKTIIFLPTTKMTQLFSELLREVARDALPATRTNIYEIHSKRTMDSRTKASNLFRNDTSGASVLVTSDVSARGIDYPGVSRVIQVGIPSSAEQYVHRVGRTGRAGTQGRGDLVLLPWERGFVSWQMSEVPLKPLTVEDHTASTLEIAKKHDEDPKGFLGGEVQLANPTGPYRGRSLFKSSVAPIVEDLPRTVSEVMTKMNEEAVNETFMSLLGYYLGKTGEMRAQKMDVLNGCKAWTTEACGLEHAPTVSRSFLDKMGVDSPKRLDAARRGGFREPRRNAWAVRGGDRVRESFGDRRGGGGRDDWKTEGARGGWKTEGVRDAWKSGGARDGFRSGGARDGLRSEGARSAWKPEGERESWKPEGARDSWKSEGKRDSWRDGGKDNWRDGGRRDGVRSPSSRPRGSRFEDLPFDR